MTVLRFENEAAKRLEAVYQTADIAAQREATLRRLAPQPGERVIDVGAGPGFLTRQLAEAVGTEGRVLGVDISEPMLGLARHRCADLPQVELAPGDARELALPGGTFDAVACVQVLEYIAAVDGAVGELFRLLRPGGRALVVATDWRALVWHSTNEDRMRRVLGAWEAHAAHACLPRTLNARLRRVGFLVESVEVFTILNLRPHADSYSRGLIGVIGDYAVEQELIARGEAETWAAELHELGAREEYFFSLGRFIFLARRPLGIDDTDLDDVGSASRGASRMRSGCRTRGRSLTVCSQVSRRPLRRASLTGCSR